jgi:hypothetical protein
MVTHSMSLIHIFSNSKDFSNNSSEEHNGKSKRTIERQSDNGVW